MTGSMEALSKSQVAEATRAVTRSRAAFDLKGVVTPVTLLRLRTKDLNMIDRQLRAKLCQTPQFFQDAPVVLDLGELEGGLAGLPLPSLVQVLRMLRIVPVGATGVSELDRDLLRMSGLSLVQTGTTTRAAQPAAAPFDPDKTPPPAAPVTATRQPPPPPPAAAVTATRRPEPPPLPAPRLDSHRPPMVVRTAVRGGQVIYARQTDLIVMAPVNPGAQIFADGHIHIYSTLRGRAMAGAQGLAEARIFVQKLDAELVAIAGAYVMSEDIPRQLRGKAAQVFIENGECRLSAL
jgi:septum site-determining protein MinC